MDGFDAAQTFAAPAGSRARSARRGDGGGWHRRGVAPEGAGEGAGAVPFRPA